MRSRHNSRSGSGRPAKTDRNTPRRFWFGPGTILALLIGGAAVAANWSGPRPEPVNAGKIAFAADAEGRLKRVDAAPPGLPSPVRPLWKPEVNQLLEHGAVLKLTSRQRTALARLEHAWQRDKAGLEASLRDASSDTAAVLDRTDAYHGAPLKALQRGLGDYSRMSREYDARRADYWFRGAALLDKNQRQTVEGWAKTGGPERGAK